MGSADRIIRVIMATILVAISLTGIASGILSFILAGVGLILVVTAFTGFCPLYRAFRISTVDDEEGKMHRDGVN